MFFIWALSELGEADYRYTTSYTLLFCCCLPKIVKMHLNFLKLLSGTLLAFSSLML